MTVPRLRPVPETAARVELTLEERLMNAKIERDLAIEQYENLAAEVRDRGRGQFASGNVVVTVRPTRSWNKAEAEKLYGDRVLRLQVDQKLAEKNLTGAEYEGLYKETGKDTVRVEFAQ